MPSDYDFSKQVEFSDFKYIAIGLWFKVLMDMKNVKKGIVLIGSFISQKDFDRALELFPEYKV